LYSLTPLINGSTITASSNSKATSKEYCNSSFDLTTQTPIELPSFTGFKITGNLSIFISSFFVKYL